MTKNFDLTKAREWSKFKKNKSIYDDTISNSLHFPEAMVNYFDDVEGICAGFSILWLICMMQTYANKKYFDNILTFYNKTLILAELDKKTIEDIKVILKSNQKFDIDGFYNTIYKMNLALKVRSNTKTKKLKHDNFIRQVKSLFIIGNYYLSSNKFYFFKYIDKRDLIQKLNNTIKNAMNPKDDHLCFYINTGLHAMAIYIQKTGNYLTDDYLKIFFYDPNDGLGHSGFSAKKPIYSAKNNINIENILKNIKLDFDQSYFGDYNLKYFSIFVFTKEDFNLNKTKCDQMIESRHKVSYDQE
jgi:hypothetical protein